MALLSHPMPLQTARQRRPYVGRYFRLGYAGLLAGTVVVVCVLSILYLAQTGRVATRGYQLQLLEAEHKKLIREAEQYQFRIASGQKLTVIQERAEKLGLRPATPAQVRYIDVELRGAAAPQP